MPKLLHYDDIISLNIVDTSGGGSTRSRRSTQTLVSAATAYRRYQTAAALQRAARSFGGLTG